MAKPKSAPLAALSLAHPGARGAHRKHHLLVLTPARTTQTRSAGSADGHLSCRRVAWSGVGEVLRRSPGDPLQAARQPRWSFPSSHCEQPRAPPDSVAVVAAWLDCLQQVGWTAEWCSPDTSLQLCALLLIRPRVKEAVSPQAVAWRPRAAPGLQRPPPTQVVCR